MTNGSRDSPSRLLIVIFFPLHYQSDWDDMDNTPRSNRKLMVNMDDDTGSFGQINDTFEDDIETQDFDDLIFALKTGGHFDPDEDEKPTPDRQEHFELRRISIPDTHL